jgi:benzoate-CoA ligase
MILFIQHQKYFSPTVLFSVPAVYKNLYGFNLQDSGIDKIRLFFSAGAHLPKELLLAWKNKYAIIIYDGLGATEMCHVFLSNNKENISPGSTGKILPGYQYKLLDSEGLEVQSALPTDDENDR